MELFLLGLSHQTAPVAVREKLVGNDNYLIELYKQLSIEIAAGQLSEGVFLFTCNRVEFMGVAADPLLAKDRIISLFAEVSKTSIKEFESYLYFYENKEAIKHIFRVASSLDSLIIGEPQILGQAKKAFQKASKHRTGGPLLIKLMHKCFFTAKKVRTETALAKHAVSIPYAAVELAKQTLGHLENKNVLLLGAGEMAQLTAKNLKCQGVQSLFVATRTFENAKKLASEYQGTAISWEEKDAFLSKMDIVIASTSAPDPIITKKLLEPILEKRNSPLLLIDIAVPRDIADEVYSLPQVIVKDIDQLREIVGGNVAFRENEAKKAELIIENQVESYLKWLKELSTWPTITALIQKAEDIKVLELERTLPRLNLNLEQTEIIEMMTSSLIKRLLHDPIKFIKKSCVHYGQGERKLYDVRRVFGLDDNNK